MAFQYNVDMGNPNNYGIVGWDPEKNTYFFHAKSLASSGGGPETIVHVGVRVNEIWSLETLDLTVTAYNGVGIDRETIVALHSDKQRGQYEHRPAVEESPKQSNNLPWPKPL